MADALKNPADMGVPVGTIVDFISTTIPQGWMECDGSAIGRTRFVSLFALIGTTFGVGDGSTTFNLPDLRGRGSIGRGTGSGLTARTLGATGGEEAHQLVDAELSSHTHTSAAHTHTLSAHTHTSAAHSHTSVSTLVVTNSGSNNAGLSIAAGGTAGQISTNSTTPGATGGPSTANTGSTTPGVTGTTGSDTAHNTMQPFVVLTKIIKVLSY